MTFKAKDILFIYHKNNKIKALDLDHGKAYHDKLHSDGWKHTATINAAAFIQNLCNETPKDEPIREINKLKR